MQEPIRPDHEKPASPTGRIVMIVMPADDSWQGKELRQSLRDNGWLPLEKLLPEEEAKRVAEEIFAGNKVNFSIGYAYGRKDLEITDDHVIVHREDSLLPRVLVTGDFAQLELRIMRELHERARGDLVPMSIGGVSRSEAIRRNFDYAYGGAGGSTIAEELLQWAKENQGPVITKPRDDKRDGFRRKIPEKGAPQPSPWARQKKRR